MLRAGEYSPNNPLVRAERASGDVFFGLGEYERRRNTLRRLRQQQYREYLDEQAKKKQEAKERAEKERRAREEKDREREERERERLELERERESPEHRASLIQVPSTDTNYLNSKVDTGIQVNGVARPLSVAVQTDEVDLFPLSPALCKHETTQAERELSPHSVSGGEPLAQRWETSTRRRSHDDYHEISAMKKSSRERLMSELRHSYRPSIFDADAIKLRNLQTEKEAAARRRFHQQELKNQIMEQQRIREERKSREKLLEQAEMRRLEEQLRMLRAAQDREFIKQHRITTQMKETSEEYEKQRTELQKEIDFENRRLVQARSQPLRSSKSQRDPVNSKIEEKTSKLPFYYPHIPETRKDKNTQSFVPNNSLFSPDYDVDKYLRRNLNFNINKPNSNIDYDNGMIINDNKINGKANGNLNEVILKEKKDTEIDSLPIPILRHSPRNNSDIADNNNLSEAMKKVDDKWRIPAVQKNILQSLPNEEGKNLSILTQLGSIRRQLQLEQLKLDNMVSKTEI